MTPSQTWKYVFICLAITILAVGAKNYLVFLVHDTALCPYLCPSLFGEQPLELPLVLERLFASQAWLQDTAQAGFEALWPDRFGLFATIIAAPLIEEGLYRGPLYLTRRHSGHWVWRTAAIVLAAVFALSHGRAGLALLPLLAFGVCSAWLVMKTNRFWPSLALHTLFNFHFASVNLCRSIFW